MSKADKMFEELGYIFEKANETEGYCKVIIAGKKQKGIIFENDFKEILFNLSYYDKEGNFKYKNITISKEELQAINEKVKELGWNE